MKSKNSIQIIEKPESVSWNDIQRVLWNAHKENRDNGIIMKHQSLSGDEIKNLIGNDGIMFIAMDGGKCIGTAGLKFKEVTFWFGQAKCAYRCFGGVLPEYQGYGVYKKLTEQVEAYSYDKGIKIMMLNTHPQNKRVIDICKRIGYRKVKFTSSDKYKYVYLIKWLDGCPFSNLKCRYEYLKCKSFALLKYYIKGVFLKMKPILG